MPTSQHGNTGNNPHDLSHRPWSDPEVRKLLIKSEDPIYGHYVAQKLSYYLVRATQRLPLSPNHFTILAIFTGLLAAVFFAQGTYQGLLIGVALLNLSLILDCGDGQLARLKGLKSQFGAWFDYHADRVKDGFVLLGWAYGAYIAEGSTIPWIFMVAFLGIFFQFLRGMTAQNRDIFHLQQSGKKDQDYAIQSGDHVSQFRRSLNHTMLFRLADRVMLYTLFGIFNLAKEAVIVYAVLACIYASISGFLNYRLYYRFDKNKQNKEKTQ